MTHGTNLTEMSQSSSAYGGRWGKRHIGTWAPAAASAAAPPSLARCCPCSRTRTPSSTCPSGQSWGRSIRPARRSWTHNSSPPLPHPTPHPLLLLLLSMMHCGDVRQSGVARPVPPALPPAPSPPQPRHNQYPPLSQVDRVNH